MKKKQKKQRKENCFIGLIKDISLLMVVEAAFLAIWNTLIAIPRWIYRMYTSIPVFEFT